MAKPESGTRQSDFRAHAPTCLTILPEARHDIIDMADIRAETPAPLWLSSVLFCFVFTFYRLGEKYLKLFIKVKESTGT